MKNLPEGFNSRYELAEELTNMMIGQLRWSSQWREVKKNEEKLTESKSPVAYCMWTNTCIMGIPEREERNG